MTVRSSAPSDLAATVREFVQENGYEVVWTTDPAEPHLGQQPTISPRNVGPVLAALDALVAVASRSADLEREREEAIEARERMRDTKDALRRSAIANRDGRWRAERRAADLEAALRDVAWMDSGGPCWCPGNDEVTDHFPRCVRARELLAAGSSVTPREGICPEHGIFGLLAAAERMQPIDRAGDTPRGPRGGEVSDEHTEGAIRMAEHWVRNPGSIVDAGFEQVARELYTISVALVRVTREEERAAAVPCPEEQP